MVAESVGRLPLPIMQGCRLESIELMLGLRHISSQRAQLLRALPEGSQIELSEAHDPPPAGRWPRSTTSIDIWPLSSTSGGVYRTKLDPFKDFVDTLDSHRQAILRCFQIGITNGVPQAINSRFSRPSRGLAAMNRPPLHRHESI